MHVAIVGGGPGGLFLATLLRRTSPDIDVTVFERNRADDTFGFGVVFSDRTLAGIHQADPVLKEALDAHGVHWEDIEVRLKGERLRCGGNGMTAIARRTLLSLLQDRARSVGADLRFSAEADLSQLRGYDLIVAADGTGSRLRDRLEPAFGSTVRTASAKFIWFGAEHLFDGLTFIHERGPHGVFAVHGYPISRDVSTFIVETDEATWRAAGMDSFDPGAPPGASDLRSKAYLEELFADHIGGKRLLGNNSRWASFRTRRTERWQTIDPAYGPVALIGDAAHTAHFSVGSGTKMAMEDAIALAEAILGQRGDIAAALSSYEAAARPSVEAIQAAARPSLSWWENFSRYFDAFEPWQFAYHFLSRSISDGRLARRAPDYVTEAHASWRARHGADPLDSPLATGVAFPCRGLAVDLHADSATLRIPGAPSLPLLSQAPAAGDADAWGGWVSAPEEESGLGAACAAADKLFKEGAALIAVTGGTALTRALLSEHVRLLRGAPSLIVVPDMDRDAAVTTVLSGRADLVGGPADLVRAWYESPETR